MKKNLSFLHRLRFAINGIRAAFRNEKSFRIQSAAGVLVVGALFVLRPTSGWWAIFAVVIGLVLAFELINTAMEAILDRLHPELHDSIRFAKDCAAGAVLVMSLVSVLVFGLFLWEKMG